MVIMPNSRKKLFQTPLDPEQCSSVKMIVR